MKTGARPDEWGEGLVFTLKTLNTKSVGRARKPAEVLPVCLRHNLRSGNATHRHRFPIDTSRTPLNEVLAGPSCPEVGEELVAHILDELGLTPGRVDSIMGIELVFQPPDGADHLRFWTCCLEWTRRRYQHLLSAVIHRDQRRPHMHALVLAVVGGRLDGNAMTSGANRALHQKRDFLACVRAELGLRPDRKVKTLADLAVSPGCGPKNAAQAARRDAALVRSAGEHWAGQGMGVRGHGGAVLPAANPHAHAEPATPLLRSLPGASSSGRVAALMALVMGRAAQ